MQFLLLPSRNASCNSRQANATYHLVAVRGSSMWERDRTDIHKEYIRYLWLLHIKLKDRQCTYNLTLRHSLVSIVAEEKQ